MGSESSGGPAGDETPGGAEADRPRYDAPLDDADPRFGPPRPPAPHRRRLVASTGPLPDPDSPSARFARIVIPAAALAALAVVVAVFVAGLSPGTGVTPLGDLSAVSAAVAERPHRVCWRSGSPCAWLTVVDGRLLALSTSGPLPEERGRQGVGWCPSSGRFASNASGSVYDAAGVLVDGPAPRGLDRYALLVDGDRVAVDFSSLQTGLQAQRVGEVVPAAGPHCETVPFDRTPELDVPLSAP